MASLSQPVTYRYYVALDLGSESMAAYCLEQGAQEGTMIDLVEHADAILGINKQPMQYIYDDGARSPRLRTIISLEDNTQGQTLPASHATLDFKTEYNSSLLRYFHDMGAGPTNLMPNPKIPFQYGSGKVIPEVRPTGGGPNVRHSPEALLRHITAQVLKNFVLNSSRLAGVPQQEIHLTLTVPNVYSLTHAESIRQFIEQQFSFGRVDVLYESDALVYFALQAKSATDDPDLQLFKDRLHKRRGQRLRIATVDVGRGTTDLSLVQLDMPQKSGDPGQHLVLGRTGTCEGGNSLSYIFARYYNDLLKEALAKFAIPCSYDFLSRSKLFVRYQTVLAKKLYDLIERLKRSITEDYRIELSASEQSADLISIVEEILGAILGKSFRTNPVFDPFRDCVVETMTLPDKLPSGLWLQSGMRRWWMKSTMRRWLKRRNPGNDAAEKRMEKLGELRSKIERYVNDSIVAMVPQLQESAAARESASGTFSRRALQKQMFDRSLTFALIAGQASHFRPLRAALEQAFQSLGFPKRQIHVLKGSMAKEACSRGAVLFQLSANQQYNPEELFGTYAFMAAVPLSDKERFLPIDMSAIKGGGTTTISVPRPSTYWVVYSPRSNFDSGAAPHFFDGSTAMLNWCSPSQLQFNVRYDPQTRTITINNTPVSLATYGDVNEDIYSKVWPEVSKTLP
jgi:hypothetical protein